MDFVILAVTAVVFSVLIFSKRVKNSQDWQATVTPLASIMGSGFLVSAPLLSGVAGNYAVICMSGLLILAYALGGAIRYNIEFFEPISNQEGTAQKVADVSRIMLALAYFTSVSYYLQLLGAFVLNAAGNTDMVYSKWISTSLLSVIALIGMTRGLGILERVEKVTVSLNLAMIAGLMGALLLYNAELVSKGAWHFQSLPVNFDTTSIRVVLGLLIVVQGFETSRYLGAEHSAAQRIRTMKFAQILSSSIYILFLACTTVLFQPGQGADVTAIIALTSVVSSLLPALISIAAVGSQFSAAVADNEGAAGLISEISKQKLSEKHSYLFILAVTLTITWLTDVNQIIAYASRIFALYYCLQCCIAFLISQKKDKQTAKTALFAVLAACSLLVFAFGLPSE